MATAAIPSSKNDRVRVNASDKDPNYLDQKLTSDDGSVTITTGSCNCALDLSVVGAGGYAETWIKTTVDFSDYNSASATVSFTPTELTGLPAGFIPLFFKFKHSTSFTGGTVSAAEMRLLMGTTVLNGLDVFQAVAATTGYYDICDNPWEKIPSQSATSDLKIRLTVTGDTCDNLTAGVMDAWIKIATLV